jgi:hypothetical protein
LQDQPDVAERHSPLEVPDKITSGAVVTAFLLSEIFYFTPWFRHAPTACTIACGC